MVNAINVSSNTTIMLLVIDAVCVSLCNQKAFVISIYLFYYPSTAAVLCSLHEYIDIQYN